MICAIEWKHSKAGSYGYPQIFHFSEKSMWETYLDIFFTDGSKVRCVENSVLFILLYTCIFVWDDDQGTRHSWNCDMIDNPHHIWIDQAAGRGDSDSRMTSFEVIMPLKLQSTMKVLLYDALHFTAGNSWKRMICLDEGKMACWSLTIALEAIW